MHKTLGLYFDIRKQEWVKAVRWLVRTWLVKSLDDQCTALCAVEAVGDRATPSYFEIEGKQDISLQPDTDVELTNDIQRSDC